MVPVIAYIIACFVGGLCSRANGSRRPSWILLGVCALLCVLYLTVDETSLPGFSLSSLSIGETGDTARRAPHWREPRAPIPGMNWVLRLNNSTVAAAFASVRRLGTSATAARLGCAFYLLGAAAILVQPRYGLYLILFCALVGDARLFPWYPFVKGFSSRESLFFVHDAFIVSPLELYIVLMAVSWSARWIWQGKLRLYTGQLFWPALAFVAFLVFGLAHGLASGGDPRMALWEARNVFYLVPLMLLTSNLTETPRHVKTALSIVLTALFIKGVTGSLYYLLVLRSDLSGIESFTEHGTAMHLNSLFVASLAVWMYKSALPKRILLPCTIPFVLLGYIAMQRRAAFITLAIAFALVLALLYKERRRLFWRLAPAVVIMGGGYVAASWNSQGTLAVPAQAIKSVYAAQLASGRDRSSNNYRGLENRNINFTIHRHPFAGIGFGQKFSMVVAMPNISQFFEWWEYITHNSIMWIWMKAGIGGFCSLLYLFGLAVVAGVRALGRLPRDGLKPAVLTATLYIVMHFIYACVDMSWDAGSTVFVGTMLGVVNSAEWIETQRQ